MNFLSISPCTPTAYHSKYSLQLFFNVTLVFELQPAPLPPFIPSSSPPLCSLSQPRVVYVQWNLGLRTKLSWLFLLWGGSPLSVVTAPKYVMFSFYMPKHTPSKFTDGRIILGGMKGRESTQETEWDPVVRRCDLQREPVMKIKS